MIHALCTMESMMLCFPNKCALDMMVDWIDRKGGACVAVVIKIDTKYFDI